MGFVARSWPCKTPLLPVRCPQSWEQTRSLYGTVPVLPSQCQGRRKFERISWGNARDFCTPMGPARG